MPKSALQIKASIRSADFGKLGEELAELEVAGVDAVHFDVMDGRFGHEIALGPDFISKLRKWTALPFEAHLWVMDPHDSIIQYVDAGTDLVVIHAEATEAPAIDIQHIVDLGMKAGLALNPGTELSDLQHCFSMCSLLNVMTIEPGKAGILSNVGVDTLKRATQIINSEGVDCLVQADGAVSFDTNALFVESGAQSLVVGYPLFSSNDRATIVTRMRGGITD